MHFQERRNPDRSSVTSASRNGTLSISGVVVTRTNGARSRRCILVTDGQRALTIGRIVRANGYGTSACCTIWITDSNCSVSVRRILVAKRDGAGAIQNLGLVARRD